MKKSNMSAKENVNKSCAVCKKLAPFKCTACKNAWYCCNDHQKIDWKNHKQMCRPFRVEKSDKLGRYLIATRDIPAKSIIFVERPLVVGPKWCINENEKHLPTFPCVGCFRPVFFNRTCCPKCKWPACSENCAGLTNSQLHELECGILCMRSINKSLENIEQLREFYRSEVLLTLRCILLQWRFPERWTTIMKLESHVEERIGTRYYKEADDRIVSFLDQHYLKRFEDVEKELKKTILPIKDREILHQICGILEVNALNVGLGGDEQQHEVSALYENACILEHNCQPNCFYTFDTNRKYKITMQAARLIRKGEHLSIMYTHMLWGTFMREEHLMQNKYFTCVCERCIDSTELNTNLSSLKCIGDVDKPCSGIILPIEPINIQTDWKCGKCEAIISNERIEIFLSNIEQEVDEMVLPAVSSRKTIATVIELEELIDKLTKFLHENHYHLFAIKHMLLQRYGHENGYSLEQLTDQHLLRKINLCEELLKIVDILDPHMIRLTLYTGIILYELFTALTETVKRKIKKKEISKIDENILSIIKEHIKRGKEAIKLNADIIQGQKLFESFEKAEKKFQKEFEKDVK